MTSSDLHPPGVQFEHEGGVAAVDDGLVLSCPRAGVRQVQELAPVELEGLGAWQEVRSGEVRWCWVVLPAMAGWVWSSAPSMRRLAQEAANTTAPAMAKV